MGPGGIVKGNYNASTLSQDQKTWLYQQFGHSGDTPAGYGGENVSGEYGNYSVGQSASDVSAQNAQGAYKEGINNAVSGLQAQGTNLDTQYGDLLTKVLGQGTVAMNTATTGENNYLASRGLQSNNGRGLNDMSSAQLAVSQSNQAAASNLSYTQAQLKNTLASTIAGVQSQGAQFAAGLPLSYGSLQLAQSIQPSNIAYLNAQTIAQQTAARYIAGPNGIPFDTQTGQYVTGAGGLPAGGQVIQKNGQYFLSIP